MEIELERLSIMLMDPTLTDQQFKDEILFLKEFPVRSIFVLPYAITRAKQLLVGTAIQVGSFVDFPLGGGTLAKKAFETGQMYRDGASDVFVTMAPEQLDLNGNLSYQALEQLSFGRNALGFFLDSSHLTDNQKQVLTTDIAQLNVSAISLGVNLTMEQAIYDMSIFRTGRKRRMTFQVNVKAPTLLEIELLFQAGASYIGINNGREILPLISKWN
ncbi:deoxyribose-phosphate aldolase [Enterococcus moraviensis ATCC BAA-383]|uniref:Deoxyribose-phosphate aldolase n=1 Tax=Enterococcus moraviensis ATCC BAA-383 TaxID=1158609 RepID=R2TSA4_9ENTE|nr:deoxyribose-phosphate aldolase [Enterococcus moraviensis]EOI03092.1 deoxyribose-phosphate aldolase [Enterococcus moraviensis ATCC BAA-383]EOT74031.1 deoxyribose-phosphate aldolase [Enterococcus moraviensis ATCC BAA-383]OJG67278.1 deoxyribose-phosphate aldolase [Enterococcus moraviensis]